MSTHLQWPLLQLIALTQFLAYFPDLFTKLDIYWLISSDSFDFGYRFGFLPVVVSYLLLFLTCCCKPDLTERMLNVIGRKAGKKELIDGVRIKIHNLEAIAYQTELGFDKKRLVWTIAYVTVIKVWWWAVDTRPFDEHTRLIHK